MFSLQDTISLIDQRLLRLERQKTVTDYGQFCPVAKATELLAKTMTDWLGICLYTDVRLGDPEMMKAAAED